MVPGDDRGAALARLPALRDPRVVHAWDAERTFARAWTVWMTSLHGEALTAALRSDPEVAGAAELLCADPERSLPAWDVLFAFRRDSTWADPLPAPAAWAKQIRYWREPSGGGSGGTFWTESRPRALVESSWLREVDRVLAGLE